MSAQLYREYYLFDITMIVIASEIEGIVICSLYSEFLGFDGLSNVFTKTVDNVPNYRMKSF